MEKINLTDVSFLIPVSIDSRDRLENIYIIINYLSKYFATNILLYETGHEQKIPAELQRLADYVFEKAASAIFKHAELNNRLIHFCRTPMAIIYDTDVIIPPQQLLESARELRANNYAFSHPYDGRFLLADYYNKRLFRQLMDIDFLTSGTNMYTVNTYYSVGGCFMFNVDEYKNCGMDNENIEGWGHEDAERAKRIEKLGYTIFRPQGPLYHLPHERTENSWFFDSNRELKSYETYFKTCAMSKEEMQAEIALWPWTKPSTQTQ